MKKVRTYKIVNADVNANSPFVFIREYPDGKKLYKNFTNPKAKGITSHDVIEYEKENYPELFETI